ncbi:MAG TPA: hypothetical protein VFZ78_08825 [Flavisolibacter sp.]
MKELIGLLENEGLAKSQAENALQVIFSWANDHYPVFATVARTMLPELDPDHQKSSNSARKDAHGASLPVT